MRQSKRFSISAPKPISISTRSVAAELKRAASVARRHICKHTDTVKRATSESDQLVTGTTEAISDTITNHWLSTRGTLFPKLRTRH